MTTRGKIEIYDSEYGHFGVRPLSYLGDSFRTFTNVCYSNGFAWNKKRGDESATLGKLDDIPALIDALRDSRFEVVVTEETRDAMGKEAKSISAEQRAIDKMLEGNVASLDSGLAPFAFQRTGMSWLAPRKAALVADEMGLGKTITALMSVTNSDPILVVAPASLKLNWAYEIRKWLPTRRVTVIASTMTKKAQGHLESHGVESMIGRVFEWPSKNEVVIINYDLLPKKDAIPLPNPATVLIGDEIHLVKSRKAQRTKKWDALRSLVLADGGRVWGLTGTPMLNRPSELWNVLIACGRLEKSVFSGGYNQFLSLCGGKRGRFGIEFGGDISEQVPELLKRVQLRRLRYEVLPDLPSKVYRDVPVNCLSASLRRLCDEVLEAIRARGVDLEALTRSLGASSDQASLLRQITQAVPFELLSKVRAQLASAKVADLIEQIEAYEDAGEPLVVMSAHRGPIDALGTRDGWMVITGEVSNESRDEAVRAFQNGDLKGLACTIKAGGVGLTLTRASHALFVDLDWTPGWNLQAEDRICRIGSTADKVTITRLVAAHPLEERIYELLGFKARMAAAIVDAAAGEGQADTRVEDIERVLKTTGSATGAGANEAAAKAKAAKRVNTKRGPANAQERWAAEGLAKLVASDSDHAAVINGVGFSKFDNDFGHSLAKQCAMTGLSDKQWAAALKICNKYRRQVGVCPAMKEVE